jgi:poly(3-hydroxybutyrate) depolymerase
VCPTQTPEQWGELVRKADPGFAGPWPRVQIWQGASDYTVAPADATELVKQWTNVWGIDQTATATDMIGPATRSRYGAGSVELYLVSGMGHAISIGNDDMGMCPASLGAFYADEKLCAPLRAAEFFGLLGDRDPGGDGSGSGSGSDAPGRDVDGGCAVADPAGMVGIVLLGLTRRRRRSM